MVLFLVPHILKYWLPVILWMIFISIASTDLMSAEHTSRFLGPFLRWFAPDTTDATIASVQLIVRKGAHLTEYAILAAVILRAIRQHVERALASGLIAFALCAVAAALDEFHQSFVGSRTGTPWDVLIDCIGALIGLLIYSRITRHRDSKNLS